MLFRCGFPIPVVLLALLLLGAAVAAPAASSLPARPYEATSANGQWRARIEQGNDQTPPRLHVYRTRAQQNAWSIPLPPPAPIAAYVTNDGRRVVAVASPYAVRDA